MSEDVKPAKRLWQVGYVASPEGGTALFSEHSVWVVATDAAAAMRKVKSSLKECSHFITSIVVQNGDVET